MPYTPWTHDAAHIRRLQNAHADYIEAMYTGLASIPGNPEAVRIQRFGNTRAYLASGERFTNRVILSGNESHADLDGLFAFYDRHQAGCVIEINPANFYPSEPFNWDSDLVPALFARGCELCHFRCVWYCPCQGWGADSADTGEILTFDHTQMETYLPLAGQVKTETDWEEEAAYLRAAEGRAGWYHYVVMLHGQPIASAAFYQAGELGYLAQADTHPEYRRLGAHGTLIKRRVLHARALGCEGVFSVTDSHTQSGRDLQRLGFTLAYNYLLFVRSPQPEDSSSDFLH